MRVPVGAALLLVAALAVPAAVSAVGGPAAVDDGGAATAREDPDADRLGWEAGYWHDDPVAVDAADGLNDTELDRVVSRAMARVEYVRGIEFETRVPVTVVSRSAYAADVRGRYDNVSTAYRLHQDVAYEALFFVNESSSTIETQAATSAVATGGYYDPGADEIVVVSENETTPKLDEITLAQELFHALQARHFDVGDYDTSTRELHNARDGIVEGDGNYVDYLYRQRCDDVWNGTCLLPSAGGDGGGAGGGSQLHVGEYLLRYQPYSDGPAFVRDIRESGGWAAVNAVYEDPPASTEQTIHPSLYGVDAPTNVTVADRSGANWSVVDVAGPVDHAAFGEAGLFAMLWYPGYESLQSNRTFTQIVPYLSLLNFAPGEDPPPIDPYNYTSRYSAGWDGDRLVPYRRADSPETNETGYVWKLAWDSPAEASEFVAGYRQLLAYHGAERVDGDVWRIPDGGFADAVRVVVNESTVVVTNAPTVAALGDVRAPTDAATAPTTTGTEATGTAPTTPPATETAALTSAADAPGTTSATTSARPVGGTSGFGVGATLLALAAAALAAWRVGR